jgi:hypothetical protein
MKLRSLILLISLLGTPAYASDKEDIEALVHDFLARADQQAAHERFWADDLVYTSSSGSRTDKATIMSGFEGAEESDPDDADAPATIYTGEEVDVRVYGDTAVVAFKLVGTPTDGSQPLYYFNTGTFLKRDGEWQVVAWQATKIPEPGTTTE